MSSFSGYANTSAIDTATASNVFDVQLTAAGIYVLNSQGLQSNLSLSRSTFVNTFITSSPNQHLNGGGEHLSVTDWEGAPECWGDSSLGQTTVPAGLASGVQLLRTGGDHNCGVQSNGTLLCFGRNEQSQTTIPVGFSTAVTQLDLG